MVNKDIKLYAKRKLKEIKKKNSKNYAVLCCSVIFGLASTINIINNKKELKKLEAEPLEE